MKGLKGRDKMDRLQELDILIQEAKERGDEEEVKNLEGEKIRLTVFIWNFLGK